MANNNITLSGTIVDSPKYSHESHGELFFKFDISVTRLSGREDKLPCVVSEVLIGKILEAELSETTVSGEVRTRSEYQADGSRILDTYVFVKEIGEYVGNLNLVELHGFVCYPPHYRKLTSDREITDLLVAVNRERVGHTDYIPCVAWGRTALRTRDVPVGTEINAVGRLQSRTYIKKTESDNDIVRTVYEVSISRLELIDGGDDE